MAHSALEVLRRFPPDHQKQELEWIRRNMDVRLYDHLDRGMAGLVRMIPATVSPLTKATVLYTVLTNAVQYDKETCRMVKEGSPVPERQSFTYVGAVLNGTAVCAGIAQLYALLCARCHIPSRVVVGYGGSEEEPGLHAWVQLRLPVRYGNPVGYNCDPTWDLKEWGGSHTYDYFLKSDRYFREHSHDWFLQIGAGLGWETFGPCPDCFPVVPWVPPELVEQMVEYLKRLRLQKQYVLKGD